MPEYVTQYIVPAVTEILYPFGNEKPSYKVKRLVLFWSIWCMTVYWIPDILSADTMPSMKTSSSVDITCLAIVIIGFTARCLIVLNLAHVLLLLTSEIWILIILRMHYDRLKRDTIPNLKRDVRHAVKRIRWLCRRAKWTQNRLEKLYPKTACLTWDIWEWMGLAPKVVPAKLVKAFDRKSRTWWWSAMEVQIGQPIPTSLDLTKSS